MRRPTITALAGLLLALLTPATAAAKDELIGFGPTLNVGSFDPRAINNRGEIAGVLVTAPGVFKPAIWKDGKITELPTTPATSGQVADINDSGLVVGGIPAPGGGTLAASWQNGTIMV